MASRSRFTPSGELRDLVVLILWDFIARRREVNPIYTVDEWRLDGSGIARNIAKAAEWAIAQAAYEAARLRDAQSEIALRNGIRVIRSACDDRAKAEWDRPDDIAPR